MLPGPESTKHRDPELNSLPASDNLCRPLILFANNLDPDHDGQNGFSPRAFLKEIFEKVNFEKKSSDDNKSMKSDPECKELKYNKKIESCTHYSR